MNGSNAGFLVAAYLVTWIAFFAYVGWLTLRIRGVRSELETVRALVDERDQRTGGGQA